MTGPKPLLVQIAVVAFTLILGVVLVRGTSDPVQL
jgi:hypothetical protein